MQLPTRIGCAVVAATVAALALAPPARGADEWTWPVRGRVITPYSNDDARPFAGGMHRGIDIAAAIGTRVVAARGGRVTYAAPLASSGLTVAVRTSDDRYDTSYLHLSAIAVKRGDSISTGDPVGAVGTTGTRSAAEPHLHFGVRVAGTDHDYVDPLSLLPPLPEPARPQPAQASVPAPVAVVPRSVPAPTLAKLAPEPGRAPARAPLSLPHPVSALRRSPATRLPVARPRPAGVVVTGPSPVPRPAAGEGARPPAHAPAAAGQRARAGSASLGPATRPTAEASPRSVPAAAAGAPDGRFGWSKALLAAGVVLLLGGALAGRRLLLARCHALLDVAKVLIVRDLPAPVHARQKRLAAAWAEVGVDRRDERCAVP
jgi:hypothetical protein